MTSLFDQAPDDDPFGADTTPSRTAAERAAAASGGSATRASRPDYVQQGYDLAFNGEPERAGGKKVRQKQVNHNQRTKALMEKYGYYCERTEWSVLIGGGQMVGRKDFLGFGDLIALKPGVALVVQITSRDGMRDRMRKMRDLPGTRPWLDAGGQIVVIGWHQPTGTGGRWEFEQRKVTVELLDQMEARKRN